MSVLLVCGTWEGVEVYVLAGIPPCHMVPVLPQQSDWD